MTFFRIFDGVGISTWLKTRGAPRGIIGDIMCFDQSVDLYCNKIFQLEGGEPTEDISDKRKIPNKLKEPRSKSKEPKANRKV